MPRPREYDEAALIACAMDAFWSRGYRRTSIEDLVSTTGVSRASLYNAYPDKRGLFMESVKRYLDEVMRDKVRRLNEVNPAGEAVRRFFLDLLDAPLGRLRRGCLLTNTAVELGFEDKGAAALIRREFARVETALRERLVEAKKAGELAEHVEPRAYARELITLAQGLLVMARIGVDPAILRDAVRAALSGIKASRARRAAAPEVRGARTRPAKKPKAR